MDISWTNCVRNEDILYSQGQEYLKAIKRKADLVTFCIGTDFQKTLLKER
jgi:hypothetical protein